MILNLARLNHLGALKTSTAQASPTTLVKWGSLGAEAGTVFVQLRWSWCAASVKPPVHLAKLKPGSGNGSGVWGPNKEIPYLLMGHGFSRIENGVAPEASDWARFCEFLWVSRKTGRQTLFQGLVIPHPLPTPHRSLWELMAEEPLPAVSLFLWLFVYLQLYLQHHYQSYNILIICQRNAKSLSCYSPIPPFNYLEATNLCLSL